MMRPQTYEITFAGQAGSTLRAEFDDCEVIVGPGRTTLRAELPDRAALSGLVQRITGLDRAFLVSETACQAGSGASVHDG